MLRRIHYLVVRGCWVVVLCILGTNASRGAIFSFTASFTNNGAPASAPFRMWLPDDLDGGPGATSSVRGFVFILPGAGDNWLHYSQKANFQKAATSLGFGLISANSIWWGYTPQETRGIVDSVLAAAANASSHPELVNSPFATMGVSQGGYNSGSIALAYPERAVGYVNIRGGYVIYGPPSSDDQLEVPGLNIVASRDELVHPAWNRIGWETWRQADAPQAYAVEWNTTHFDTRQGQSWETAWHWIGESARLRYNHAAPLSTVPGVRPQLADIEVENGWVGHAPLINETDDLEALVPPSDVEIDRIADGTFSEPLLAGSWLPSQGAASIYRAFTSHDGLSRPYFPRQGPLHFLAPVITDVAEIETPLYEVGQTVSFRTEVHPYDRVRNGIVLSDVDFYYDDQFLGNVVASNNWTVDIQFTQPGIHALIAIGHDSAGNEYPAFHTVLVAGTVPEPSSLVLIVVAGLFANRTPLSRKLRLASRQAPA